MYGVVSLLDSEHHTRIEAIWREFETNFGVHGVHKTPIPHFSYHLAEKYDMAMLKQKTANLAQEVPSFEVKTTGLGIFTGPVPVLYLPIQADARLKDTHRRIWHTLQTSATLGGSHPYYQPHLWVPHITLAEGDIDHDMLAQIIHLLSERDFTWTIKIDNLAIIGGNPEDPDQIHGIVEQFPLK